MKFKFSKAKKREYAQKMQDTEKFCNDNSIVFSASMDSFYFTLNDQQYRISNHTIEKSNAAAFKDGVQVREKYHADNRKKEVFYIHASKTRLIEIYENLKAGKKLDHKGNIIL